MFDEHGSPCKAGDLCCPCRIERLVLVGYVTRMKGIYKAAHIPDSPHLRFLKVLSFQVSSFMTATSLIAGPGFVKPRSLAAERPGHRRPQP